MAGKSYAMWKRAESRNRKRTGMKGNLWLSAKARGSLRKIVSYFSGNVCVKPTS